MGDDFNYQNARKYFKNMDTLIYHFNKRYGDEVEIFYSTPQDYVQAVNAAKIKWPVKYDDHFPYADRDHAYWTGYFTSRAVLKGYVRDLS